MNISANIMAAGITSEVICGVLFFRTAPHLPSQHCFPHERNRRAGAAPDGELAVIFVAAGANGPVGMGGKV